MYTHHMNHTYTHTHYLRSAFVHDDSNFPPSLLAPIVRPSLEF